MKTFDISVLNNNTKKEEKKNNNEKVIVQDRMDGYVPILGTNKQITWALKSRETFIEIIKNNLKRIKDNEADFSDEEVSRKLEKMQTIENKLKQIDDCNFWIELAKANVIQSPDKLMLFFNMTYESEVKTKEEIDEQKEAEFRKNTEISLEDF